MGTELNDQTLIERVDPLLGTVFDRRYRIDERLAAGGFGAIYRAQHISSNRQVALKILHPSLTHDPGVIARFRREGATLTTLRSPNTVTAYELGEAPDGTLYLVMELLRGVTLFERYRSGGRIPWRTMVIIARAVCRSLEEAHGLGIVHRDLKPTNIHLEPAPDGGDIVKVLDFGIAKILRDSDFDSSDLTNAGQMIGTLDYMSPEQMVGGQCTGQSDIYTLGIVMYEMVAGRRPFDEADSPAATLARMIKSPPVALSKRIPVPPGFDALVMRCLDREPKRRYPDVRTLGVELDRLLDDGDSEVTSTVPGGGNLELQNEEMTVIGSGRARVGQRPITEPPPTHLPADALRIPPTPRPQPPPPSVVTPTPIRVTPTPQRSAGSTTPPPAKPVISLVPPSVLRPASSTSPPPLGAPDPYAATAVQQLPYGGPPPMPGAMPPGAMRAGVMPAGAMPAGAMPAGAMPAGAMPAGAMPAGAMPAGAMPAGAMPPGAMPPGAMPPGAMPPQGAMPMQPHNPTPPWGVGYPAPSQPGYPPAGVRQPTGVRPYDMAGMQMRDAAIRRIVWIAVLVLGTIVGVVVATQL